MMRQAFAPVNEHRWLRADGEKLTFNTEQKPSAQIQQKSPHPTHQSSKIGFGYNNLGYQRISDKLDNLTDLVQLSLPLICLTRPRSLGDARGVIGSALMRMDLIALG